MSKKIKVSELPDFDMAEFLEDDQAIAEYLTVVMEDNDPALLAAALGDIARARGMSDIAKAAGLGRERCTRRYVRVLSHASTPCSACAPHWGCD